jgi:hypothetical protein
MIFHSIDNKSNCKSIILNNQIINNPDYSNLTGSWDYNIDHNNDQIEYANLYLQGKKIDDVCPPHLQDKWEEVKAKHNSFIKSFRIAEVIASDYCFYDLVPESFLLDYFGTKCEIVEHILGNFPKPKNYEFLLSLRKLLINIEENKLILNTSALTNQLHKYKTRRFREKLTKIPHAISYNLFGTITGRLTTKKNSFPILTLDKDFRSVIKPKNDFFVELDFNGAELRCLLGLNELPQPNEDIHMWNMEHVYKGAITREESKKRIFAWLYNLESKDFLSNKAYARDSLLEKYWDGENITNPFGRQIKSDKFHAINFLIQSTSSDIFLRRAIEVSAALKNKKSFTAALIHDSMLIDFSKEDKDLIPELTRIFENTGFGKFKVNKKIGLDFGNMKEF